MPGQPGKDRGGSQEFSPPAGRCRVFLIWIWIRPPCYPDQESGRSGLPISRIFYARIVSGSQCYVSAKCGHIRIENRARHKLSVQSKPFLSVNGSSYGLRGVCKFGFRGCMDTMGYERYGLYITCPLQELNLHG